MLGWALFVWLSQEIERLNVGRKDSRVLRLQKMWRRRCSRNNLHAPSGLEVQF